MIITTTIIMGTTITTIIMTEQPAVLFRLMTWLSPAFPVGAFSYSHGLEWAAENGLVRDEATLESWICMGLAQEFGPVSGMLLRRSWTAARARDSASLLDTLAEARALVATAEFELETTAQGAAFLSTLRKSSQDYPALVWAETILGLAPGPVPYAFAVGIALAAADVPLDLALTGFFQALIGNSVSAALRLLPMGQSAGQRIIARLEPAVIAAAQDALTRVDSDVGTAAPVMEWASMSHETQYTRLFRS